MISIDILLKIKETGNITDNGNEYIGSATMENFK